MSDSQTNFSTMKRGREPFRRCSRRPSKRQEISNFNDILAQIQHLGSIYFVESLPKAAIQTLKTKKTAALTLPAQFIRENGGCKTTQWVILRAHSFHGRSARPLVVQLRVSARSHGAGKIKIDGELHAAISGNRLQEGDSMVFVPQEHSPRSEFELYVFRGTQEFPLFPDEGDSAPSTDEGNNNYSNQENNNTQSSLATPLHHQDEHKEALTSDIREGNCKAVALQHASHLGPRPGFYKPSLAASNIGPPHPRFYKLLAASHIGRSDRSLFSPSGQFEFPSDFLRIHGKQVGDSVKFQGIYEDSPIQVIACRRRWSENRLRVHLLVTEWSKFVTNNALKKGHKLQFSLVADSYFLVRKV